MYVHKSNSLSNEVQPYSPLGSSADRPVRHSTGPREYFTKYYLFYTYTFHDHLTNFERSSVANEDYFSSIWSLQQTYIIFELITCTLRVIWARRHTLPNTKTPTRDNIFTLFWLFIFMLIALVRNCGNNGSCNGTVENI
uniref:Uncharacterized protein n=1 Tax=Glossina pallidipes TaxID=7398 RepID=A0A1A9ZFR1_GLOPL